MHLAQRVGNLEATVLTDAVHPSAIFLTHRQPCELDDMAPDPAWGTTHRSRNLAAEQVVALLIATSLAVLAIKTDSTTRFLDLCRVLSQMTQLCVHLWHLAASLAPLL